MNTGEREACSLLFRIICRQEDRMSHRKRRIQYNSPVVLTFAIISLIALILNGLTKGATNALIFSVYRSSIKNPFTYIRLVCHVMGHADLSHYVSNMMMFLLLGPIVEEKYGSRNLALLIVITAVITGLVNMMLFTDAALLGASGVVFCLVVLASMTSFSSGRIPLTMILVMILYIGQEIYTGLFTRDNISQLTHIIGGVIGCVYGYSYKGRR